VFPDVRCTGKILPDRGEHSVRKIFVQQ